MSLKRHAAKRDENEPAIRQRFGHHGWITRPVSGAGMPDLLVWGGLSGQGAILVDVKMPKGDVTPAQMKEWASLRRSGIPVYVVRTAEDVDALVRGELAAWTPEAVNLRCRKCGHLRSAHDKRRGCTRAHARVGACGCRGEDPPVDIRTPLGPRVRKPAPGYTPPRSKPVDAAKEADETFAPPPEPWCQRPGCIHRGGCAEDAP